LEHLRILSSTTCVGFRYGYHDTMLRGFSWKSAYIHYPFGRSLQALSGSANPADFPTRPIPTPFNALFRQCAGWSLLRHPIAHHGSMVILTHRPSRPPLGVCVGPDLPADD